MKYTSSGTYANKFLFMISVTESAEIMHALRVTNFWVYAPTDTTIFNVPKIFVRSKPNPVPSNSRTSLSIRQVLELLLQLLLLSHSLFHTFCAPELIISALPEKTSISKVATAIYFTTFHAFALLLIISKRTRFSNIILSVEPKTGLLVLIFPNIQLLVLPSIATVLTLIGTHIRVQNQKHLYCKSEREYEFASNGKITLLYLNSIVC